MNNNEYKFTIEYTIFYGGRTRNMKENFTVECNDPCTAVELVRGHVFQLMRDIRRDGCGLRNLIAKDENGKIVSEW